MAMSSSGAVTVSRAQLQSAWDALFDAHPWLDGLATVACDSVFCCPPGDVDVDWDVLTRAGGLLFLATGVSGVRVLLRDLVA